MGYWIFEYIEKLYFNNLYHIIKPKLGNEIEKMNKRLNLKCF